MDRNYVDEISSLYQARCGKTILSPEDYTLIAEWEKQEIPFEVVAVTIDLICERLGINAEIKSIEFFDDEINANFRRWLQLSDRGPHISPKKHN